LKTGANGDGSPLGIGDIVSDMEQSSSKSNRQRLNQALQTAGNAIGPPFLALIGLAFLLTFLFGLPIGCFVGLVYLGIETSVLIGSTVGPLFGFAAFVVLIVVFAAIFPFMVMLFLAIYVWEPHIKPALLRALEELK